MTTALQAVPFRKDMLGSERHVAVTSQLVKKLIVFHAVIGDCDQLGHAR